MYKRGGVGYARGLGMLSDKIKPEQVSKLISIKMIKRHDKCHFNVSAAV